jgi:hypothetical protein
MHNPRLSFEAVGATLLLRDLAVTHVNLKELQDWS